MQITYIYILLCNNKTLPIAVISCRFWRRSNGLLCLQLFPPSKQRFGKNKKRNSRSSLACCWNSMTPKHHQRHPWRDSGRPAWVTLLFCHWSCSFLHSGRDSSITSLGTERQTPKRRYNVMWMTYVPHIHNIIKKIWYFRNVLCYPHYPQILSNSQLFNVLRWCETAWATICAGYFITMTLHALSIICSQSGILPKCRDG